MFSSVATPSISHNADTYEIVSGTAVTLTCTSDSDPGRSGTYEWKKGNLVE